jgi:hypothetical protein
MEKSNEEIIETPETKHETSPETKPSEYVESQPLYTTKYKLGELYTRYWILMKQKEDFDFKCEIPESELRYVEMAILHLLNHIATDVEQNAVESSDVEKHMNMLLTPDEDRSIAN